MNLCDIRIVCSLLHQNTPLDNEIHTNFNIIANFHGANSILILHLHYTYCLGIEHMKNSLEGRFRGSLVFS